MRWWAKHRWMTSKWSEPWNSVSFLRKPSKGIKKANQENQLNYSSLHEKEDSAQKEKRKMSRKQITVVHWQSTGATKLVSLARFSWSAISANSKGIIRKNPASHLIAMMIRGLGFAILSRIYDLVCAQLAIPQNLDPRWSHSMSAANWFKATYHTRWRASCTYACS